MRFQDGREVAAEVVATDPSTDGNVLYIFMFDNAVKGADYDPVKILSEAFPTEVNALYEKPVKELDPEDIAVMRRAFFRG